METLSPAGTPPPDSSYLNKDPLELYNDDKGGYRNSTSGKLGSEDPGNREGNLGGGDTSDKDPRNRDSIGGNSSTNDSDNEVTRTNKRAHSRKNMELVKKVASKKGITTSKKGICGA